MSRSPCPSTARLHLRLLASLLLAACGPAQVTPGPGGSVTGDASTGRPGTDGGSQADGSSTGTGPEPTTTVTNSTTTTTGDPPATSGSETGEVVACELLQDCFYPESICIIDGAGRHLPDCVPNPDGCVPRPVCSPACAALCVDHGYCPGQVPETVPPRLNCPSKCDTFAVDPGCPRGKKCVPEGYCTPIDPDPVPVGEPCPDAMYDPCVEGAYCALISGGTCRPFCTGSLDAPICPEGSACIAVGDAHLCFPACDPLAPDCDDTQLCLPGSGMGPFICAPDGSDAPGTLYSPCQYANACDLGLFCSAVKPAGSCDPDAEACCLPFCDLNAPICPDDLECVAWYAMDPPPGLEDVGACLPPP